MTPKKGQIAEYDDKTRTARIVASDGSSVSAHATPLMASLDYAGGSEDFKPPVPGNLCVYIDDGRGEAFIVGYYLPINLGPKETPEWGVVDVDDPNPELETTTGAWYTRNPDNKTTQSQNLPGDKVTTGKSGSSFGFKDTIFQCVINPLLSFTMTALNNVTEICTSILHFKSPGLEVHSITNESKDCDVQVLVRENSGDLSKPIAVDLKIGKTAGLIRLSINGESLLRVDNQRNVLLEGKNLVVQFENVDMSHSGKVYLP